MKKIILVILLSMISCKFIRGVDKEEQDLERKSDQDNNEKKSTISVAKNDNDLNQVNQYPIIKKHKKYKIGNSSISSKVIADELIGQNFDYQLVENGHIGTGTQGIVFLARKPNNLNVVAVKYLFHKDSSSNEGSITIREDILQTSGFEFKVEARGRLEVMPYLRGNLLSDWLRDSKIFEEKNRVIYNNMLDYIAKIVNHKIFYFDLAAHNILYDSDRKVWVGFDGEPRRRQGSTRCDALLEFNQRYIEGSWSNGAYSWKSYTDTEDHPKLLLMMRKVEDRFPECKNN